MAVYLESLLLQRVCEASCVVNSHTVTQNSSEGRPLPLQCLSQLHHASGARGLSACRHCASLRVLPARPTPTGVTDAPPNCRARGQLCSPRQSRPASRFCRTCSPQGPAGSVLTSLCSLSRLFRCAPLSWQREERCPVPGRVRRPQHADLGSWGWVHKASGRGQAWPCSGWCRRRLGTFPRPLSSATQQATFSHPLPPVAQGPLFGGAARAFQG